MANIEKFPLEARGETVSREALVQAALHEITQNYREASLSNVARSYGVSLAYVSECVRAQTGKTYKELLQKHRMGQKAHQMILDALAALTAEDETAARKVIAADDEVDYDFNAIKHTLAREIAADPGKVDAALDLLMVIKYLERIGDHAVNLAEWVEFVRTGCYHNETLF